MNRLNSFNHIEPGVLDLVHFKQAIRAWRLDANAHLPEVCLGHQLHGLFILAQVDRELGHELHRLRK